MIRNLTNKVFGRWTVVSFAGTSNNQKALWNCKCECGETGIVIGGNLTSGTSTSCGCYEKELKTTHGMWRTSEYRAWQDMKDRSYNPKNKFYPAYGGRGITVCERWLECFENFIADMGEKLDPKESLDRIEVDKGYYKDNCRWAFNLVQQRNRRDNHFIHTEWGYITIAEAVEKSGLTKETISGRIRLGWPEHKLLMPQRASSGDK